MNDESLLGQRINSIMDIHDQQAGSLVNLLSHPNEFILDNTEETTQLATTLTDDALQVISVIVTFINADTSEST